MTERMAEDRLNLLERAAKTVHDDLGNSTAYLIVPGPVRTWCDYSPEVLREARRARESEDTLRADQQKMVATLQRIELATLPANQAYVPPDSVDELCQRASEALNTAFNTIRVGGSALTDRDLGAAVTDPGDDGEAKAGGWRR